MNVNHYADAASHWRSVSRILIICHEKPDGDAIASLLAIAEVVKQISPAVRVDCVCIDPVPEAFRFLTEADLVHHDFLGGDAEAVVIVDCGDLKRTGYADRLIKLSRRGVHITNIDHHPKNDLHRIASLNIVDSTAASTTQIIYELASYLDVPITPALATYIFTGLYTDTGSFQHPITTPDALRVAALMMAKGARIKEVRRNLIHEKPIAGLKLWGIALTRVRLNRYGMAISVITERDLQQSGGSEEDLAGVVGMLETVHKCRAALLLVEMPNGSIKGSVRSNNSTIDAERVAKVFGGGGHTKAAGFVVPGRIRMDKGQWTIV